VQKLRRVLVAFSWSSDQIGYCQGLNFIVGMSLLPAGIWCMGLTGSVQR
jgi:hypothetical protein